MQSDEEAQLLAAFENHRDQNGELNDLDPQSLEIIETLRNMGMDGINGLTDLNNNPDLSGIEQLTESLGGIENL